jgi:hypothetical protein
MRVAEVREKWREVGEAYVQQWNDYDNDEAAEYVLMYFCIDR